LTFGYAYKTPDGTRHEATFSAKTKEDVFASLRERGVKPIKVWEIHSKYYVSKRTRVIILLAVATVVSLVYALLMRREARAVRVEPQVLPRHQIYGDPAIMEEIEHDNFASVFPDKGDQILAAYAIPGRQMTGSWRISREGIKAALEATKDKDVSIMPDDSAEVMALKRIVQGMKEELRWYIADGVGTVESYLARLRERQDEEIRIYERTRQELENCTDTKLREERNAALRAMGLKTIPRPKAGAMR